MRNFINMVEAMSSYEAKQIFSDFGHPVDGLDAAGIKAAWRKIAPTVHPDVTGGDDVDVKKLNAAYDVIRNGVNTGTSSSARSSTSRDGRESNPDLGFFDLRNVQNYFNTKAKGQPGAKKYTIHNFEFQFFRGCWSAYGTPQMLPEMAKVMVEWDRFNSSMAVFAFSSDEPGVIQLIRWEGGSYAGNGPRIEFDSFNENPSNDSSIADRIRKMLADLKSKNDDQFGLDF